MSVEIPYGGPMNPDPDGPGSKPSWMVDKDGLIYIRCACGVILGTPSEHSIECDGEVHASLLHTGEVSGRPSCGWHVFGRLAGWAQGRMERGQAKIADRAALPEFE